MKKINLYLILVLMFLVSACEDYVTDVDSFIDRVVDEDLDREDQVEFQLTGLDIATAYCVDDLFALSDALGDVLWFDKAKITGATYQSLDEIDQAEILDDNITSGQPYDNIAELRLMSEKLLDRVQNKITFEDQDLKNKTIFKCYLLSGYSKYLLGSYYGNERSVGGGTINLGELLPTNTLYDMAISDVKKALEVVEEGSYNAKVANSLLARIALFQGNYTEALAYADKGLVAGDPAYTTKYNSDQTNYYRDQAGESRVQLAIDFRFVDYVAADAEEAKRLQFESEVYKGFTFYKQTKYFDIVSEITLFDWQEINLIKAEIKIRNSENADDLVNAVRVSHNMTSMVNNLDLNGLFVERDKELWLRGFRLIDQRRTNAFHIAGGWQYLPIPRREKTKNPNLD